MHDGFYTTDFERLAHGPVNAYSLTAGILDHLDPPFALAYGNHDTSVGAGAVSRCGLQLRQSLSPPFALA